MKSDKDKTKTDKEQINWIKAPDLAVKINAAIATVWRRIHWARDNCTELYTLLVKKDENNPHKHLYNEQLLTDLVNDWVSMKEQWYVHKPYVDKKAKENLRKRKKENTEKREKIKKKRHQEPHKTQYEIKKEKVLKGFKKPITPKVMDEYNLISHRDEVERTKDAVTNPDFQALLNDPEFLLYAADRYVSKLYDELKDHDRERFKRLLPIWAMYEMCEFNLSMCVKMNGLNITTYSNWTRFIPQIGMAHQVYKAKVKQLLREINIEDALIGLKQLSAGGAYEEMSNKYEYRATPTGVVRKLVETKVNEKVRAPNFQAIQFLLTNRNPSNWKVRQSLDVSPVDDGPKDNLSELTINERLNLLNELMDKRDKRLKESE